VLGEPLLDARSLGLEVYRKTGRDIDYLLAFGVPIPTPGDKAIVIVLVVYDEDDVVKEIATRHWAGQLSWKITAGGFHFTTNYVSGPQTLLGPSITWKDLAEMKAADGRCALVLVNGMCAMEQVSLGNRIIIDLSPAHRLCRGSLNGTYIRMDISPGKHHLSVRKKHSQFETEFECESEENVYVELEATSIPDWWWGKRLEGAISINKSPYKNLIDMGDLHPIIWHRGVWYRPSDIPSTPSQ
jgi:hypothetical protein